MYIYVNVCIMIYHIIDHLKQRLEAFFFQNFFAEEVIDVGVGVSKSSLTNILIE